MTNEQKLIDSIAKKLGKHVEVEYQTLPSGLDVCIRVTFMGEEIAYQWIPDRNRSTIFRGGYHWDK